MSDITGMSGAQRVDIPLSRGGVLEISTASSGGDLGFGACADATGSAEQRSEESGWQRWLRHAGPSRASRCQIDPSLVAKASEIVESICPDDAFETAIALDTLAGMVMEMWKSAALAEGPHQDVLAVLESGVRQSVLKGCVTAEQRDHFRELLSDLSLSPLVGEHAEIARYRSTRVGFGSLAFIDNDECAPNDAT